MRDLTWQQFVSACERSGWQVGAIGYVRITPSAYINRFNAGNNRRAQLAYLQHEADRVVLIEHDPIVIGHDAVATGQDAVAL